MIVYVLVENGDTRIIPSVRVFRRPERAIKEARAEQYMNEAMDYLQENGIFILCDFTIYRVKIKEE